jgi:hypothetical protein
VYEVLFVACMYLWSYRPQEPNNSVSAAKTVLCRETSQETRFAINHSYLEQFEPTKRPKIGNS